MARPLRILIPDGWYHVMSRGNRRASLFWEESDRRRFLGLVSELPERFHLEVHAFVLMDNHYHLVVRTPQANLSQAIRWLHVSYSSRFNWAHRQVGHLFQGRFKAVVIQEVRGVCEVARCVHSNPVRIQGLGLGQAEQRRAKVLGLRGSRGGSGGPAVAGLGRLSLEFMAGLLGGRAQVGLATD
jgi:putative transposase